MLTTGLTRLKWLLRECRSVAQALEHEGKGGATGTEVVAHPQERVMPKPPPLPSHAPTHVDVRTCNPIARPASLRPRCVTALGTESVVVGARGGVLYSCGSLEDSRGLKHWERDLKGQGLSY